jgi:hypothetical protein
MAQSAEPWWADARLWVGVFVVLFWPAALLADVPGVLVLLAVVGVAAFVTQKAAARRGSTARP